MSNPLLSRDLCFIPQKKTRMKDPLRALPLSDAGGSETLLESANLSFWKRTKRPNGRYYKADTIF